MDPREAWRKQEAFSYFYSRFWKMDKVEAAIFLSRQRDAHTDPESKFAPWASDTVGAAFKSVAEKKEELRNAPWEDRVFANLVARFRGMETWKMHSVVSGEYERRLEPSISGLKDAEARASDRVICAQARAARDYVLNERTATGFKARPA